MSENCNCQNCTQFKLKLNAAIFEEIRYAKSDAVISLFLRSKLEQLDKSARKEIVSIVRKEEHSPLLFFSVERGCLKIVKYLIETCGADMEQKGNYHNLQLFEGSCEGVTPLWLASVSAFCGDLSIIKYLVEKGAKVNVVCDNGYTALRGASRVNKKEVLRYLVDHAGADIHLPGYSGTCLLTPVRCISSVSVCEFLLMRGADVNEQDVELKTALHHAIELHCFPCAIKLFIKHGANPFLKNLQGDDAFQTACSKGTMHIFTYLLSEFQGRISRERLANLNELMGSKVLMYWYHRYDYHDPVEMALKYWRKAMEIRYDPQRMLPDLPKKPMEYVPPYATSLNDEGIAVQISEFNTKEELEEIATDQKLMQKHGLLIAERILGVGHEDLIYMLEEYKFSRYYTLQLRIQRDSLLGSDACEAFSNLIESFMRMNNESKPGCDFNALVRDFMATFLVVAEHILECARLVKVRPVSKKHEENFDECLLCFMVLLCLLISAPNKTQEESFQLKKIMEKMVRHSPRTCKEGDTMLHIAVVELTYVIHNKPELNHVAETVKYLIECGANVNAVNDKRATPLHLAVLYRNFDLTVVHVLVENGAHLDSSDYKNQSPLEVLRNNLNPYCSEPEKIVAVNLLRLEHVPLKCIAARVVVNSGVDYAHFPRKLRDFIELHRQTKTY